MAYHLLLTRPKHEGQATKYMDTAAKHINSQFSDIIDPSFHASSQKHSISPNDLYYKSSPYDIQFDPFMLRPYQVQRSEMDSFTSPVASELYRAQLIAYASAFDPRDSWSNSIVDICYPTKPDPRNPNNKVALITGYVFVRYADPNNPLPQDILNRSTSNIRYLTVFSHDAPDPSTLNPKTGQCTRTMPVYVPYTMDDDAVRDLPQTLNDNQTRVVQSLVGKKIRIPSGVCMGMPGKIKKVTNYPNNPDEAVVLVKVMHDGMFSKTYLSFTLSELG